MFQALTFPVCFCLVLTATCVAEGQELNLETAYSPAPAISQSSDQVVSQEFLINDGMGSGNCRNVNCGCGGALAGRARCKCHLNRLSGGALRQRSESALETMAKSLNVREMPTGTQGLNMPYHTPQMYHYKRPYNTLHVRSARQQFQDGAVGAPGNRAHVYSTEVFDEIHQQLAPMHRRSTDLGYLEYSDWRKYEAARQEWEFHRPGNAVERASTPGKGNSIKTETSALPTNTTSRKTRALLGSTSVSAAK